MDTMKNAKEVAGLADVQKMAQALEQNIARVVVGCGGQVRLTVASLLAGGHVLLEDVPGTGKTMLAKALARSIQGSFGRVQFTPDLLPSELTGIQVYQPQSGAFTFRQGALFANVLLADEINRATPRTQSGLLEAMEERQVSVDGTTHPLPSPFFVIATQNPVETQGTFPLPEAQMDRFLVRLSLGYPATEDSVDILRRYVRQSPLETLQPVCRAEELPALCAAVRGVYVHDEVLRYITRLCEATRENEAVQLGASARGALALAKLAQATAAAEGRAFVTPDDVKPLAGAVLCHRLLLRGGGLGTGQARAAAQVVQDIVAAVPVPVEDWGAKA